MIEPESVGTLVQRKDAIAYVKRNGDHLVEVGVRARSDRAEILLSCREAEHLRRALSRAIREIKEFTEMETAQ